jgi:hypothetical protein
MFGSPENMAIYQTWLADNSCGQVECDICTIKENEIIDSQNFTLYPTKDAVADLAAYALSNGTNPHNQVW